MPPRTPRRRGRRGGRPSAIDAEKLAAVVAALDGGATKAAVCRTFGLKRSTLIDSLTRIGWSAGLRVSARLLDGLFLFLGLVILLRGVAGRAERFAPQPGILPQILAIVEIATAKG